MAEKHAVETETFHNQRITKDAARSQARAGAKPSKRIVVLQLDEEEYAAFQAKGGVRGLRALLKKP